MIKEKFEVRKYEVVENWLPPVTFVKRIREYLNKAEVYQCIVLRLEENRGDEYNFDVIAKFYGTERKRTVRVERNRIVLVDGTKEIYEVQGIMPSNFDKFANFVAEAIGEDYKW